MTYGIRLNTAILSMIGYGLAQAGLWILVGLYDAARWPLNLDCHSNVDTTEDY